MSPATFRAGGDLVPDPYVRERASSHDAVVPPSRAVAVEHRLLDPVAEEVTTGRRVWCDDTGRRDVIGGHRVAEFEQNPGSVDRLNRLRIRREINEERRLLHVRRVGIPRVDRL